MKYSRCLAVAVLVLTCAVQVSNAVIYPFEVFTQNGSYWDEEGAIQCYVDVTGDDNLADFTFYNSSAVDCSIMSIYFDDGLLFEISGIIDGPGVEFIYPANPANLPAGSILDVPFETTIDFCAKGTPPPPVNGINNTENEEPVEWVTIQFELINGNMFADVLNGLTDSTFRVGIHLAAFPDCFGESAVTIIPEPATFVLLGVGAFLLRKRR